MAAVEAHIYFADTFIAGESHARNIGWLVRGQERAGQGRIDTGRHTYRGLIAPATHLPVSLIILMHDLNTPEPLGMLHPVDAGYEQASRETVTGWQSRAIHLDCNQRGWL